MPAQLWRRCNSRTCPTQIKWSLRNERKGWRSSTLIHRFCWPGNKPQPMSRLARAKLLRLRAAGPHKHRCFQGITNRCPRTRAGAVRVLGPNADTALMIAVLRAWEGRRPGSCRCPTARELLVVDTGGRHCATFCFPRAVYALCRRRRSRPCSCADLMPERARGTN
jgi:hypothetical protein